MLLKQVACIACVYDCVEKQQSQFVNRNSISISAQIVIVLFTYYCPRIAIITAKDLTCQNDSIAGGNTINNQDLNITSQYHPIVEGVVQYTFILPHI